jgi:putative DNA primase/helicase
VSAEATVTPLPTSRRDYNLTDVGTAQRLVDRHGIDLHYLYAWNKWLVWNGQAWEFDETGEAERRLKETLRATAADLAEVNDDKRRKELMRYLLDAERASRIRGALELARSEPGIAIHHEHLDANPLLFNVANATLNLSADGPRAQQRDDLITKIAPVDFDIDAKAPLWDSFLQRIFPDAALRAYVARLVGYCLTGETGEQVLPIGYGSGANGKSTFIETIRALFGDYAMQCPPETFLERRESIPNDVARLRGSRLAIATEFSEGKRLNEALVKRMTGGDKIVARFMRAEFFEFTPTFKVWLITNHMPEVRGTDDAIWRRIRLIPFTVTIPADERDPHLSAKLREELAGILNWAIRGYLDWRKHGLDTPEAVTDATDRYREDSDVIGNFLADCCTTDNADAWTKAGLLYDRYVRWTHDNGGELPVTSTAFGKRLADRFEKKRTGDARGWKGIALIGGDDR